MDNNIQKKNNYKNSLPPKKRITEELNWEPFTKEKLELLANDEKELLKLHGIEIPTPIQSSWVFIN